MHLLSKPGHTVATELPPAPAAGSLQDSLRGGESLTGGGLRLPEPRTAVNVVSRSGESMPAWVLEQHRTNLLLVVTVRIGILAPETLAGMVLKFGIRCGLARLEGTFEQVNPREPELLLMTKPCLADVVQQRAHVRVDVHRPAVVFASGAHIRCQTVDISAGGCQLERASKLKVGQTIAFEILLSPVDQPIKELHTSCATPDPADEASSSTRSSRANGGS